jgi:hypothetical protein
MNLSTTIFVKLYKLKSVRLVLRVVAVGFARIGSQFLKITHKVELNIYSWRC